MNLFEARSLVALADASKRYRDVEVVSNPTALAVKSAIVSTGITDVSNETADDIREASKSASIDEAQGLMLRAFWRESAANGFGLHAASGTRLMVNPPEWLPADSASGTLRGTGQKFLTGQYGTLVKSGEAISPLVRMAIRQQDETAVGYFDELVVFWDYGIDIRPILDCVTTGTAIVLVSPDVRACNNLAWVTWTKFDSSFPKIRDEVSKRFKTSLVSTSKSAGSLIRVLGIS